MSELENVAPEERVNIGPSWGCLVHRILFSPLFWCCVPMILFWHSVGFQRFIYQATGTVPSLRRGTVGFYAWGTQHYLPFVTWTVILLIVAYALARWKSDSYTVGGKFLYVATGLFERHSNTVSLALVVDCDAAQNPLQSMIGAGDLVIRTSEGERVFLSYVRSITESRDQVLAHTQLENVRIYGRI